MSVDEINQGNLKGLLMYNAKIAKYMEAEILFEDSWKLGGLQFADLIANALFINLEPSKRISSPYNLLRNKILIQRLIPWKALKKFKL